MAEIKAMTVAPTKAQETILLRLGAALILQWDELPDELQDLLIDQATTAIEEAALDVSRPQIESCIRDAKTKRIFKPT